MRVACQVLQDVFRPSERSLCVDNPLKAFQLRGQPTKCGRLSEMRGGTGQPQLSRVPCRTEQLQELVPKPAAKHPNRQEEPFAAVDPSRAIVGQTACWHEAMHVRMQTDLLIPGVQNGKEPDSGTHPLWIGCD